MKAIVIVLSRKGAEDATRRAGVERRKVGKHFWREKL